MKKENLEIIKCPRCGREYLPAEIFMPNSFLGKPIDIVKTYDGKIDFFDGESMNLKETYRCDCCDAPMVVTAKVTFKVDINSKYDFTEEVNTFGFSPFILTTFTASAI